MPHEPVIFDNGTASMRNTVHGEAMHSSVGPAEEARAVHIEPSQLAERLLRDPREGPVVLWDLGLGIAANALAALRCWETLPADARRPLEIWSFETDITALEAARRAPNVFPFLRGQAARLRALVNAGEWREPGLRWRLRRGDFAAASAPCDPGAVAEVGAPEILFFDFYSPRAIPQLWSYAIFRMIYEACAPLRATGRTSVLTTYCSATRVRSAMMLAGFRVGQGPGTGVKRETTLAFSGPGRPDRPLGAAWRAHLQRSDRPWPEDLPWTPVEAMARLTPSGLEFEDAHPLSGHVARGDLPGARAPRNRGDVG